MSRVQCSGYDPFWQPGSPCYQGKDMVKIIMMIVMVILWFGIMIMLSRQGDGDDNYDDCDGDIIVWYYDYTVKARRWW